jgi:hypothetical protein
MPVVMEAEGDEMAPMVKRRMNWRECAQRALRLHGI